LIKYTFHLFLTPFSASVSSSLTYHHIPAPQLLLFFSILSLIYTPHPFNLFIDFSFFINSIKNITLHSQYIVVFSDIFYFHIKYSKKEEPFQLFFFIDSGK